MENEVRKKIFDFVYDMALRDATLQKAYNGEKKPLFKQELPRNLIECYISALLRGDNPDFYETASQVEKSFRTEGFEFTFGNTQKLINMTVKYFYITAYGDTNYINLRRKFSNCHCPMDSIMIKKVIDKLKDKTNVEEVQIILRGHEKDWRKTLRQPWSKMSIGDNEDRNEQYEMFQKIISYLCNQEGLTPIEYDFKNWH